MAKSLTHTDYKNELLTLYQLLKKHFNDNLQNYHEGLNRAITKLGSERNGYMGYEDIKIEFKNIDLGKNVRPVIEKNQWRNAVLELRMTNIKWQKLDEKTPLKDPIQDYQLQLILKISDTSALLAKSAWHFEKHPDKKTDGTPDDSPEFHHPLYHLHFGGYELTNEEDFDFGKILIVEAPRIMHPPMDIIIAIDFVLTNFYSTQTCPRLVKLTTDPQYIRILSAAKERFWKPFALGFASNFIKNYNFQGINHMSVNSTYAKNLISYSKEN